MAMTNSEILSDIEDLTQRIRQHRIEQGLLPEPKRIDPFVSVGLSNAIMDRLQPFVRIAVKYTALLADGVLHRLDTSAFAEYRQYAETLCFSRSFWGKYSGALGVICMLRVMDNVNTAADEDIHIPEVLRTAHFAIEWMRKGYGDDGIHFPDETPEEGKARRQANSDEYKRLKADSDAFDAEYAEARRQYELIKGDIENYECE
ncbi:hypothetical protein AB4Z21_15165 [Paenibacillus sp. MCAF20]